MLRGKEFRVIILLFKLAWLELASHYGGLTLGRWKHGCDLPQGLINSLYPIDILLSVQVSVTCIGIRPAELILLSLNSIKFFLYLGQRRCLL